MDSEVIAAGLARIQEQLTGMAEKIDRLITQGETHNNTLSRHEARLAVLEARSGGWKTAVAILSPIVSIVAFGLVLANQLYL